MHSAALQKKLNLNEQHLIDTKETLKRKTKVHLDLEDVIQKMSFSLSESKIDRKSNEKKVKVQELTISQFETKVKDLEHERKNLIQTITELKAKNGTLNTTLIQKDNVRISDQTKYESLKRQFTEQQTNYESMVKDLEKYKSENQEMASQCGQKQMDIDILENRLAHYERKGVDGADESERIRSNLENKVDSLREMISDLELQNKHNLQTIDQLHVMQSEHAQFKRKYAELKGTNDSMEEKVVDLEVKYNNLHSNYQSKTEQFNAASARLEEVCWSRCLAFCDFEVERRCSKAVGFPWAI